MCTFRCVYITVSYKNNTTATPTITAKNTDADSLSAYLAIEKPSLPEPGTRPRSASWASSRCSSRWPAPLTRPRRPSPSWRRATAATRIDIQLVAASGQLGAVCISLLIPATSRRSLWCSTTRCAATRWSGRQERERADAGPDDGRELGATRRRRSTRCSTSAGCRRAHPRQPQGRQEPARRAHRGRPGHRAGLARQDTRHHQPARGDVQDHVDRRQQSEQARPRQAGRGRQGAVAQPRLTWTGTRARAARTRRRRSPTSLATLNALHDLFEAQAAHIEWTVCADPAGLYLVIVGEPGG